MEHYKCQICGYVYNPDEGDPLGGVDPGTDFLDLCGRLHTVLYAQQEKANLN